MPSVQVIAEQRAMLVKQNESSAEQMAEYVLDTPQSDGRKRRPKSGGFQSGGQSDDQSDDKRQPMRRPLVTG